MGEIKINIEKTKVMAVGGAYLVTNLNLEGMEIGQLDAFNNLSVRMLGIVYKSHFDLLAAKVEL